MDDFVSLFTSREGRIGRSRFWLGVVMIAVAGVILNFVLGAIFGVQMFGGPNIENAADMEALMAQAIDQVAKSGWVALITFLILIYPVSALFIKRLHDRNNDGKIFWIYAIVAFLSLLMQALGLGMQLTDMGGFMVPTPTMLGGIVGVVVALLGLYLLVVCGFLKGTAGPNDYGPDPIGG